MKKRISNPYSDKTFPPHVGELIEKETGKKYSEVEEIVDKAFDMLEKGFASGELKLEELLCQM